MRLKAYESSADDATGSLEQVAAEGNLLVAWARVRRNHGAPGVDGVRIEDFEADFAQQLAVVQSALLTDAYQPRPVRTIEVPKASGGLRLLGIPTVRDRLILQALVQQLAPLWEPDFSPCSFAYRPGRTPQQAVAAAQAILQSGHRWVVDLDIEKFFPHVDHVRLMLRLGQRVTDVRVLDLIADFLRAGRSRNGVVSPTRLGLAQGSPLSPLLANIVLDELDQELTRRGWPFVRYADDCIVFARDQAAGRAVLRHVGAFLERRLKLRLHPGKTRVVQPAQADYLGFTYRIGHYGEVHRRVTGPAVKALRQRVRALSRVRPGDTCGRLFRRVALHVRGWAAYYGFGQSGVADRTLAWERRRLRAAAWELWATPARRQRELERRGVPRAQANQAAWRLTFPDSFDRLPALIRALPDRAFRRWGLLHPPQRKPAPRPKTARPVEPPPPPDTGRWRLLARIGRRLHVTTWPPPPEAPESNSPATPPAPPTNP